MSIAQKIIERLPYSVKFKIIKLLYGRKGKKLEDLKIYGKGRFYLYKVDGIYVPSESLGWFITFPYYVDWVNNLSSAFYRPSPGDVVIDIGAGLGEEAIVFSNILGPLGKLYCIEANPEVFKVLKDGLKLNGSNNSFLFNIAINNKDERVILEDDDSTFLSGKITLNVKKASNQFEIVGSRLDTFIINNKISKVDLLKVNIEGAERFVIESVGDCINRIRNVAISCHDFRFRKEGGNEFFKTKELVSNFLIANDFEIQTLNTGEEHKDDWIFGKKK